MPTEPINILPFLTVMIVVAVLLIFFVISSIIIFRKVKNLRIQSGKNLIAHEERMKAKIAGELHDELSSSLASIRLQIQSIQVSDAELRNQLEKVEDRIGALTPRIRDISFNLMPVHLSKFGLSEAIKDLAEQSNTQGIKTRVMVPSLQLPKEISLQIFRIVQEILTNTKKHSRASESQVQIRYQGKYLVINVSDNGIGFDRRVIFRDSKGIGFSNIRSRVEILRGKLNLTTGINAGVHYQIKIPAYEFRENKNSYR